MEIVNLLFSTVYTPRPVTIRMVVGRVGLQPFLKLKASSQRFGASVVSESGMLLGLSSNLMSHSYLDGAYRMSLLWCSLRLISRILPEEPCLANPSLRNAGLILHSPCRYASDCPQILHTSSIQCFGDEREWSVSGS